MNLQRQTSQSESTLEIKKATWEDRQILQDLVSSSAHWYEKIVDEQDMNEHAVDEEWAKTNLALRDFYIGYEDDEPIGLISLQYFHDFVYLGYIYLDTRHVGKGYGRKLIDFAQDMSASKGYSTMALISHPEAVWAVKAYKKYGFKVFASKKEEVLSWKNGVMQPYYEQGFHLFTYEIASEEKPAVKLGRLIPFPFHRIPALKTKIGK